MGILVRIVKYKIQEFEKNDRFGFVKHLCPGFQLNKKIGLCFIKFCR